MIRKDYFVSPIPRGSVGTPKEIATDAFSAARNRMGCVSGISDSGRSNELLV